MTTQLIASENEIFDIDVDGLNKWTFTPWDHDAEFPFDWRLFNDFLNPLSLKTLAFKAMRSVCLNHSPILEMFDMDFPKQCLYLLRILPDMFADADDDGAYDVEFLISYVDGIDDRFELFSILNILKEDPYWLHEGRKLCLSFRLNSNRRFIADKMFTSDLRACWSTQAAKGICYRTLYDLIKDIALLVMFRNDVDYLQAMLLAQGIEPNPGPASVAFHNYASKNIEFLDVVIYEKAQFVDDCSLEWSVRIALPNRPQFSSAVHLNSNKKVCYEKCYEEIMKKVLTDADEIVRNQQAVEQRGKILETLITKLIEQRMRLDDVTHESENIEGSHGEDNSMTLTALHTNLDVTTEESAGVPTIVTVLNEMKTTTENIGNYDNLTGQYYLLDHFTWDTTSAGLLKEYVLPRVLLTSNIAANSPILIPFNVNYMWRGVLEIRIQTKAQMFLTGQLQVSSFYELDADADSAYRRNVYTASQTSHVLVNAGGSNDAVLYIPYVNRQPFVQVKFDTQNTNTHSLLNMVNVLIQVLNPLRVGTGSSTVDVVVFVRFVESRFHGKRDGAIGEFPNALRLNVSDIQHESFMDIVGMIGTGVRVAEKVLREFKTDKNRDNPPDISPSTMLVPYAAQSWAHGTDVSEPLRTLRLSPLGQTLHNDVVENITELSQIVQTFGLFRTIHWNETDLSGVTLLSVPCEPLMSPSFYVLDIVNPTSENRYIPPVGVITSLFNVFRGPLKFRMDMIANKFYTGELIMGYIPGLNPTDVVTNEMLRNSAFTTYALDANNLSITYETPFINAAEWYNARFRKPYASANCRLPGVFVVNVLQRLQQPENVNGEIDINIYMAAGSGFECANLTQPALVVPADSTFVVDPNLVLTALNDHLNNFGQVTEVGGWGDPVMQGWSNGTQTIALLYSAVFPNVAFIGRSSVAMTLNGSDYLDYLFLMVAGNLRIFMIDQSDIGISALKTALNGGPYTDSDASRAALRAAVPSVFTITLGPIVYWPTIPSFRIEWALGDPVFAEHESERDAQPNLITSVQHYATNGWGMNSFGEHFGNVKDLLRRPIHNEDYVYADHVDNKFPNALFKFKVTPVPPTPNLTDQFDLINRSSHTKILLSGYRYYRGGMRYRIVMPYLPGVYAWCQYDSSDKMPLDSVVYPVVGFRTPIATHSNPQDLLTLSVNQILNVEIPWYNPNQLNLLQSVNYGTMDVDQITGADLGSIKVGLSTNTTETIPGTYAIKVFSKVADDFCPYVFQGFPPMASLLYLNPTDVGLRDVEHEMFRGYVQAGVTTNVIDPIVDEVKGRIDGVAQDVRAQISDVTSSIAEALTEIIGKIKKSANISLDFNFNIVLTDLVSQLGHCLMNPSIKTLVWAVISMLTKIGVLSFNVIAKAIGLFNSICSIIFKTSLNILGTNQTESGAQNVVADHEAEGEDTLMEDTAGFWGLIISSCASLIGLTSYSGCGGKEIAGKIGKDLRNFAMTSNSLTGFFKLHLSIIKKIFGHLCFWRLVSEKEPGSMFVYNESFIRTWCNEVSYLTMPGMQTRINGDAYLNDRVYLAYMIGEIISKAVIVNTEHKVNNAILSKYLDKIRKVHAACISTGKTGNVRRETFGIWIDGNPGVGKSSLVEDLSTMLVLRANVEFEGDIKLPLNPTDDFWTRCDKQPVLWLDDAFQVTTERLIEKQLSAYFSVMSPTPLCPPMADLKDKDKLYEPYFMITTANSAFPMVKAVSSQKALWRRRHVLMKVAINHEYIKGLDPAYDGKYEKVDDIPKDFANYDYDHLKFRFAIDPSNSYTAWTDWHTWAEAKAFISVVYDNFYERALRSYNHRLNKYYEAKRQVMPEYFNDKDNVPNSHNLFDIARDLAMKLDRAAQETDKMEWYDLMTVQKSSMLKSLWNMPKHMCAMMVGIYPSFTYGVNTILNGRLPTKKGYETYKVHGLGWDTGHSRACPATARQIVREDIVRPTNHSGVVGGVRRDVNPFSKRNRDGVAGAYDLEKFCNPFEPEIEIDDDLVEQLEDAMADIDDEDSDYDLFDMRDLLDDVAHESGVDSSELIAKIKKHVVCMTMDRNKLLTLMCFLSRFKEYGEDVYVDMLDFYECTLRSEIEAGVKTVRLHAIVRCVYDYVKFRLMNVEGVPDCVHYDILDSHYYLSSDKFKRCVASTSTVNDMNFVVRGSVCMSSCCALKSACFKELIFGYVICPEGYPAYFENHVEEVIKELELENIETYKERCMYHLREWASNLYEIFTNWWKVIGAGLAMCIGIWYVFFKKANDVYSEGTAYDKNKAKVQTRKLVAKRKIVKLTPTEKQITDTGAQHESNQNLNDIIKKITRNVLFLHVVYSDENGIMRAKNYRVIMLGGRRCLVIRHYIEEIVYYATIDPKCNLYLLTNGDHKVPIGVDAIRSFGVLEHQVEDDFDESREGTGELIYNGLCVVDMPMHIPQYCNIIKHFVSERDEKRMSSNGVLLRPEPGSSGTKGIGTVHSHVVVFKNCDNVFVNARGATSAVSLDRTWEYRVRGFGMCGSLLLNSDSGKIIGVHTAGSEAGGVGYSERLVREEWTDEEVDIMEVFQPVMEEITLDDRQLEGSVFPLGKVPKVYAKNESGKSKIIPSVIHGVCEVKTFPAPLSPYDERLPPGSSPLYDGVAIHGNPPIAFPQDLVDKAGKDYSDLIIAKCPPKRPVSVWSEQEAIFGNSLLGVESMPLDTSEGFPLSALRPKGSKGKGWLFPVIERNEAGEVVRYELRPELRSLLDVTAEMRNRGIKPFTVFTDCLKDETLPARKCKRGGTRIFSMSPVQFTIQSRQYLGDWILAHVTHRRGAEHRIGMNVYSAEWTELLHDSNRAGKCHVAGDHGKFGPRYQSAVARAVFDGIYAWYEHYGATDHHLKIIKIMAEELINAVHLCFDILYQVYCGIVSGSLFTANFNSAGNSIYHRIAWLWLTKYQTFKEYYEYTYLFTYGDDGNVGVNELIIDKFNVKTLHDFFKYHDMEYTDVHKNVPENIEPWCDIRDSSFLKHQWLPHSRKHGYYTAALSKDSIEGQLNWISQDGDAMCNTKVNCISALRQAWGHGSEYYYELYDKIKGALIEHGEHFVYKSFDELWIDLENNFYEC